MSTMTPTESLALCIVPGLTVADIERVAATGHVSSDGMSCVVNGGGPAVNLAAARVLIGASARYAGMNVLVLPVYRADSSTGGVL